MRLAKATELVAKESPGLAKGSAEAIAEAKRFYSDGAPFMPAGLVFYMSAGMSAFYLLKLQDKSHSSKKSE